MPDPMNIDELRRQALTLSLDDRARLARDLLHSLDGLSEGEIEQLWLDEAERRRDEVVSGAVDTVAMADALAEVRAARP
jgi:hypothetical protein